MRSLSLGGSAFATARTLEINPPCVNIAPFASTVVPIVKIIEATVSGVIATFGKSVGISDVAVISLIFCTCGFANANASRHFAKTLADTKIDLASVNSAMAKISDAGVCASSGTTAAPSWTAAR